MRIVGTLVRLGLVFAIGFAWGARAERDQVFPFEQLRSARRALGLVEERPRLHLDSASGGVSVRQTSRFEELASLPYVGVAEVEGVLAGGVVVHDAERAFDGLNLFTAGYAEQAVLMDMDGSIVREWSLPRDALEWDSPLARRQKRNGWRSVAVTPDLELYVVYDYLGMAKLAADGTPLWVYRGGAHHAFRVAPSGEVHVLDHRIAVVPELSPRPVIVDHVTVLGPDGEVRRSTSILEAILRSPIAFLLPSIAHVETEHAIDVLHGNSIEVFDGSLAALSPIFADGNVLIGLRNLSTVVVLDPSLERVLWSWGPTNVSYPHDAHLLASGRLLLFDNGTSGSRVLELDPRTHRIEWAWAGTETMPLRSRIYGAARRLPNGNTLVTDSMQARALEVTPGGEVVWAFENPLTHEGTPTVLFEMSRVARSHFTTPPDAGENRTQEESR